MTATREPSVHGSELVRLVGADTEVPLVTGGTRRYVNLDYAASAPALQAVHDAVEELLRLVLERPSRRGVQVAGVDRRLRGRARIDSALRQRARRRRGDHHPQHHRLDQPPRGHAPRGHARGRLRGRAPRQPAALEADRGALSAGPRDPGRDARAARGRPCATSPIARTRISSRRPAPRTSPARSGRLPRSRGWRTSTARGCWWTRHSWRHTRRSTCSATASTTSRCPATSSTRRTAPAR